MTFELVCPTGVSGTDLPQLEGLYGLAPTTQQAGLGLAPLLIGGGIAATAAITAWLEDDDWDIGTYNNMVLKIDDLIHEIDQLGWTGNCWKKHPAKRKAFKRFWARWSRHYAEHGRIETKSWLGDDCLTCYVPDSAENPVRDDLLPELKGWVNWLQRVCGQETAAPESVKDPAREKSSPSATAFALGAGGTMLAVGLGIGALLLFATRR